MQGPRERVNTCRDGDRRSMKKPTVKFSKGEVGRVRIVEDFLPSPDRLVLREDNVKVTLSLSQRSVAFFKRAACPTSA
ncbi:hypothetical protein SAMN05443247_05206 [Bradyrhizobium erythrophlei]|jgi:hypothetical protein|nr:hypothetical protein SAMN05443247_05206 [Bradyrhizobium erythrophlei]